MNTLIQSPRRFGMCAIDAAIVMILGLSVSVCAEEGKVTRESEDSPRTWTQVISSARVEALEMLARQIQGNYEKIRTWTGAYSAEQKVLTSDSFLARLDPTGNRPSEPVIDDSKFVMHFAIDIASGKIYRSMETFELKWVQETSKQIVKMPKVRNKDERSVVDSEQYLHFDAKHILPVSRASPSRGKNVARKRVGYRDAAAEAENRDLGNLMDPRLFYCAGPSLTLWDWLDGLRKNVKEDALRLYQAPAVAGNWYRLVQEYQDGLYNLTVFSPEAGFNPVSLIICASESGDEPSKVLRWQWKRVDGIYVPAAVEQSNLSSEPPRRLNMYRRVTLEECTLNQPLDPQQFTYRAIGMEDGDLVFDNIRKRAYAIKGGALQEVADVPEDSLPEGFGRGSRSTAQILALCLTFLLIFLVLLVARRYRSRAAIQK